MSVFVLSVLATSVSLQFGAAVVALLLARMGAFRTPAALLATAIVLMAIRRAFSFVQLVSGRIAPSASIVPELVALVISIVMISGLIMLRRKLAEISRSHDETLAALEERGLLLRESHHHAKNDLYLLQSLVALERDASRDPAASSVLQDFSARIRTISLLHDRIYEPDGDGSFLLYLDGLIQGARDSYSVDGKTVSFDTSIEEVPLSRSQLIHCGLIFNEAITNALKYAFAGVKSPRITVVARSGDGGGRLEVRDNGVGLPEEPVDGGFGMTLMASIARLEGWELTVSANDGTCVRLVF